MAQHRQERRIVSERVQEQSRQTRVATDTSRLIGNFAGCYPFQDTDPFVLKDCPHVFFVGNQPKFEKAVIEGPTGQSVVLLAIPVYRDTGEVVLLDTNTLETEIVRFDVFDNNEIEMLL